MESTYLKLNNGTYAYAKWIKSRKLFRMYYYYPDGSRLLGSYFKPESLQKLRRLKNKPTKKMLQKAGWGF